MQGKHSILLLDIMKWTFIASVLTQGMWESEKTAHAHV